MVARGCLLLLIASCVSGAPGVGAADAAARSAAAASSAATATESITPPAGSARAAASAVGPPAGAQPLAERRTSGCDVQVDALLDAHVYTGSPDSPMKSAMYRSGSKAARFAAAHDHGANYLSCTWLVSVNGTSYRYVRSSRWGPRDLDLSSAGCDEPAEARAAAVAVVAFTRACTDLHAGEYYGERLEPLGGAPQPDGGEEE